MAYAPCRHNYNEKDSENPVNLVNSESKRHQFPSPEVLFSPSQLFPTSVSLLLVTMR